MEQVEPLRGPAPSPHPNTALVIRDAARTGLYVNRKPMANGVDISEKELYCNRFII